VPARSDEGALHPKSEPGPEAGPEPGREPGP
jgi:hypothetical protein